MKRFIDIELAAGRIALELGVLPVLEDTGNGKALTVRCDLFCHSIYCFRDGATYKVKLESVEDTIDDGLLEQSRFEEFCESHPEAMF